MARRVENGALTSRATRLPSLPTGSIFLVITSWKNKTRNVQTSAWSSHRQIEKEWYLRQISAPSLGIKRFVQVFAKGSSARWSLCEGSSVLHNDYHLQSSNRRPSNNLMGGESTLVGSIFGKSASFLIIDTTNRIFFTKAIDFGIIPLLYDQPHTPLKGHAPEKMRSLFCAQVYCDRPVIKRGGGSASN